MAPGALPLPPDIVRSVFAELVVTDLARARWFWVDVLGFVVTESEPGALYLRGYDELTHHNLILTEGAEPAAARLAYRVRTPADLDRAVDFYASLGCRTRAAGRDHTRDRPGRAGRGPARLHRRVLL